MQSALQMLSITAPLFVLVGLGYLLARFGGWQGVVSDALAKFVFTVAIPALLFKLTSDFAKLPNVDAWLLLAYFGGTFVVYAIGFGIGRTVFSQHGVSASVFGMGGVFANTVLLGIPLTRVTLGERAIPAISLVIVFHSLALWTLVSVTVEWVRHRTPSLLGLARTARGVALNPIVASILIGTRMLPGAVRPRLLAVSLGGAIAAIILAMLV